MNKELEFTPERMRQMGYRVVDRLVEHFATLPNQRVGTKGHPATLLAALREPLPEDGMDFEVVLEQLERDVLGHTMHVNHPRFFAYVPGPGNFVGAMADAIISGYNVFAGTWLSGSGPAVVELTVIEWLRELCGLPPAAGGLFVSGGTMANLTALAVARRQKCPGSLENATVYFSDQVHSSLEKALRVIGLPPANVRKLIADTSFRLPVNELSRRISQDQAAGKQPFCVIASAGTTNTGAIDPLPEISRLCREQNIWLHVDGAYGAAAVITTRGRELLAGLELSDSLSLDPHKWLFQPYETGCLLVRDRNHLSDAFRILQEYLKDTQLKSDEINFTDYGIQLTRNFRSLKLWMSIKVFGMAAFRAGIEHGFVLAEFTEACLRGMPGWKVVTPAQMGIVCFRHSGLDDNGHLGLVQTLLQDGFALITSTVLNQQTVLRTCTINPRTTEADIRQTLGKLDGFARQAAKV